MIEFEEEKKKRLKKSEQTLRTCGTPSGEATYTLWEHYFNFGL